MRNGAATCVSGRLKKCGWMWSCDRLLVGSRRGGGQARSCCPVVGSTGEAPRSSPDREAPTDTVTEEENLSC